MDSRKLAKAFKALSNPNRLQIYSELIQRRSLGPQEIHQCGITDFINSLNVGAPTISHHIKELVNAELIDVERQGKYVNCSLNEAMCKQLRNFFNLLPNE